jgi:hypothetical protein
MRLGASQSRSNQFKKLWGVGDGLGARSTDRERDKSV